MKKEIENAEDIKLMVNTFYDHVRNNPEIGYLFDDVAKVNWEAHLPTMYNFWEGTLLGTGGYRGNPIIKHQELNEKEKLNSGHFQTWIRIFNQTIDELFIGESAERAKQRATSIATIMQLKIH